MKKLFYLLILFVLAATGCKQNGFTISGNLTGAGEGTYIYLDRLGAQLLEPVDSTTINQEGYFMFEGSIDMPEFFLLRVNEQSFITTLVEPGENMTIIANADSLGYPTSVEGSKGTGLMLEYNRRLMQAVDQLGELTDVYYANIESENLDQIMEDLDVRAQGILGEINEYTKEYIDNNLGSLVAMVALYQQVSPGVYVLNPDEDWDYFEKVDASLYKMFPESDPVVTLHQQIESMRQTMGARTGRVGIGTIAPDFTLTSPDGEEIALSSTRGKVVLLDFWAAWCPPCRRENPNLVAAYESYKDKGFEIFQVSLDQTEEAWLKGIEEDKLGEWIHVSDLKYWDSMVVPLYNLESIPASFLLDRDGKVIATNLRGEELENKLKEIF